MTELVPDYVEPLIAWRTWAIARRGGRATLRSVVKSTSWEPGAALEAKCLRLRVPGLCRRHTAPAVCCSCGIYASELAVASRYLDEPQLAFCTRYVQKIIGRVALWGDVVECESGYRGTFAYPHSLFVALRDARGSERGDAHAVAAALRAYGVPVAVIDADDSKLSLALSSLDDAIAIRNVGG